MDGDLGCAGPRIPGIWTQRVQICPQTPEEKPVASSPHSFIKVTQRRTHTGVESVSQFKSAFEETI